MPQYLADIKEKEFFVQDDEARHLTLVARHKEGDVVTVFDGKGKQYTARIERVQKNFVRGVLLEALPPRKSALSLELCFAPTSRNTLEDVLDKCTQLGVDSFLPIHTARSEYLFPWPHSGIFRPCWPMRPKKPVRWPGDWKNWAPLLPCAFISAPPEGGPMRKWSSPPNTAFYPLRWGRTFCVPKRLV